MSKLKIVSVSGDTKENAVAKSGLAKFLDVKYDATQAWKKEGTPDPKSTYFKAFDEEYINKKVKGIEGIGFTVTVEPGVPDTRERPYKETNIPTEGTRKYTSFYEGLVGGDDKGKTGTIVFIADDKAAGIKKAKEYVTDHRDARVILRLVKLVTEGQPVAAIIDYAPSAAATLGTYIVFGYERDAA